MLAASIVESDTLALAPLCAGSAAPAAPAQGSTKGGDIGGENGVPRGVSFELEVSSSLVWSSLIAYRHPTMLLRVSHKGGPMQKPGCAMPRGFFFS